MKKILLALFFFAVLFALAYNFKERDRMGNYQADIVVTTTKSPSQFIGCLADAGVRIYGSSTCPACTNLLSYYSDFGSLDAIYFDCSSADEKIREKCYENMQTEYVPEIQINGVLFEGTGTPEVLAEITNCQL